MEKHEQDASWVAIMAFGLVIVVLLLILFVVAPDISGLADRISILEGTPVAEEGK